MRLGRTVRWLFTSIGATAGFLVLIHAAIEVFCRIEPPPISLGGGAVQVQAGIRSLDDSYARKVGRILEVRLAGAPADVGEAHSRLLYDEMLATEGAVWSLLDRLVPNRFTQLLLLDYAQARYRNAAASMSQARRREIAAGALAFAPDPFEHRFSTYQRFVFLNTLYDISLAFEGSPLIGCTTFLLTPEITESGAPLLARAFDFEVDEVFDEKKAVFLVREDGSVPFASVAWPGLAGVVTGMNAHGVAVVVHGARAGSTLAEGEPVVHGLRRVLSRAKTTAEAVGLLDEGTAMVSHIVAILDGAGNGAIVERVAQRRQHVIRFTEARAVTNHLEGPAAGDAKNREVIETTSTIARRRRADALLAERDVPYDATRAVRLLRDRAKPDGAPLPLGDRRSIDALIATHGVVMNTRDRVLWVSEGPHLLGRFVAFELSRLLAPGYSPESDMSPRRTIEPDPLLETPEYRRFASRDGSAWSPQAP